VDDPHVGRAPARRQPGNPGREKNGEPKPAATAAGERADHAWAAASLETLSNRSFTFCQFTFLRNAFMYDVLSVP